MSELIPAVLDELHTRFRRYGAQTIFGPSTQWLEEKLFAIGVSTEDIDAVDQTSTRAGLGRKRAHSFTVACLAHVRTGNSSDAAMQEVTREAFKMLAFARKSISDDPTLGKLVMRSEITNVSYLPRRENGAVALVEFRVRVDDHR